MNPPLPLRVVSSAALAIAEAADRWAANRPKAPDALVTDLEKALQLIASHPGIGARARNVSWQVYGASTWREFIITYYRVSSEPATEHTSREVSAKL